jgi:hypothetical protein
MVAGSATFALFLPAPKECCVADDVSALLSPLSEGFPAGLVRRLEVPQSEELLRELRDFR